MGADNQAESILERNPGLPAIAKIKQDLASRSVAGVPMSQIRATRRKLVAEFERLKACTHK